jgi:acetylornithine deacetylase/succinyl-diaminopimelate desuccinylase-like protein
VLGVPAVLMGFGLPDDNTHAPNEKTHLPTFERSVGACQEFLARIASAESHNIRSSGNG